MSFPSRREAPTIITGARISRGEDVDGDSDSDGGRGGGGGGDDLLGASRGGVGGAENLLGKKTRVARVTFNESHLISQDGMWKLYSQMQVLQNTKLSQKRGDEVS